MKKLLSALFVLALCSSVVLANVPDPSNCEVTPDLNNGVLVSGDDPEPLNGTTYTIIVRNSSNTPIENASVVFDLDDNMEICTTAIHTGTTNGDGECVIILKGGGCVFNTAGAAEVKANGILIKSFNNAKSPDNGAHETSAGDGVVDVSDLVAFADEFNGNQPEVCHDYDNTGAVDVGDLPFFGDGFSAGTHCTLIP
jgi:hypothetical protein